MAVIALGGMLCAASCAQADEACAPVAASGGESKPTVGMVGMGAIDPAWWGGMTAYLEDVLLGIPVRAALLEAPEWSAEALADDVRDVLETEISPCSEHERQVVVVWDRQAGGEIAPDWLSSVCRAISRPMAWAPVKGDDAPAVPEQIWRGRAERHIVAQALRLLGTPACMLPQCLMHADESPLDMDLKARNMCPPCQEAFKQRWGLWEAVSEPAAEPLAHP